jgi:hypothetical protein
MSLSATTVALLLTFATTAHGVEPVHGEVREDGASTTVEVREAGEVASHPGDAALYERFFNVPDSTTMPAPSEEPVAKKMGEMSVPWWLIPIGMLAIGVLLLMRNKVTKVAVSRQAIRIISRTQMGKEGSLAMIEVADGDQRTRRLLVGFGGGAPRLVADVSAWDVAVAAPSPVLADEPRATVAMPIAIAEEMPIAIAEEISIVPAAVDGVGAFARALSAVSAPEDSRVEETPVIAMVPEDHDYLVADVLAMHDAKPLNGVPKPVSAVYSRRTVVA